MLALPVSLCVLGVQRFAEAVESAKFHRSKLLGCLSLLWESLFRVILVAGTTRLVVVRKAGLLPLIVTVFSLSIGFVGNS